MFNVTKMDETGTWQVFVVYNGFLIVEIAAILRSWDSYWGMRFRCGSIKVNETYLNYNHFRNVEKGMNEMLCLKDLLCTFGK